MFHSQFALGYDSYMDNNNFLRYNTIKTSDERFYISKTEKFDYFDLQVNPAWKQDIRYTATHNMSIGDGPFQEIV